MLCEIETPASVPLPIERLQERSGPVERGERARRIPRILESVAQVVEDSADEKTEYTSVQHDGHSGPCQVADSTVHSSIQRARTLRVARCSSASCSDHVTTSS